MEFRHLGDSGLIVSEIAYGNWLTHGSQVEEDAAQACVRAALDAGITTFDTADVYAGSRAEEVLGRALQGERREGLEVFTKVFWSMGPGKNDRGLSRKHILESIDASLRRLQTDVRRRLPGAPLRQRDAARGDDAGVRRRRPCRQGALHRCLGVDRRPDPCRRGPRSASSVSRWSRTSRSTRCCGASSRPRSSRRLRSSGSGRSCSPPSRRACSPGSTGRVSSHPLGRERPTTRAAPT